MHPQNTPLASDRRAAPASVDRNLPRLGQGFVWQELSVGQRFRTFRRTVTETDLVSFIGVTGMLEAIFIEDGYEGGAMAGRPVPWIMVCRMKPSMSA